MLESLATTSVHCWLTHARLVRNLDGLVYLGFKWLLLFTNHKSLLIYLNLHHTNHFPSFNHYHSIKITAFPWWNNKIMSFTTTIAWPAIIWNNSHTISRLQFPILTFNVTEVKEFEFTTCHFRTLKGKIGEYNWTSVFGWLYNNDVDKWRCLMILCLM